MQVVFRDRRMLGQRQHDRRDHVGARDRVVLHQPQEELEIEAGHADDRDALVEADVQQHREAIDVIEGQNRHRDFPLRGLDDCGGLHDVRDEVSVGEHHALR